MLLSPGFRKYPLLKILCALLVGILCVHILPQSIKGVSIAVVSVLVLTLALYFGFRTRYSETFPGVFLLVVVMLCGMLLHMQALKHSSLPEQKLEYAAIAFGLASQGDNSARLDCRLLTVDIDGKILEVGEKVRIFMRDDTAMQNIQIGDSLYFSARFQRTRNASNPKGFRYDKYLQNIGIWHTAFLDTKDFKVGGYSGKMILRRKAAMIQSAIVSSFSKHGIKGEELAIISALVAGERSQISEAIREDYASAGAMHILAVSGLHVGILYLFLQLLLFKGNELPVYRKSRFLIVIIILWAYAFTTGLSPSVIRATLMFSLFQLGKTFNRPANSINILAASAFIILALNPLQLFHLGFQFSYLAVLGILLFQPALEKLIVFKNTLADRTWQLITISISVQVTTFPLALFYFNQFPFYFLLTNILIIPMVWVIMLLSVLFFVSLPFSFLVPYSAKILNALVFAMNYSVDWISNLPQALISDIRFGHAHLYGWYTIILMSMFLSTRKNVSRFIRFALVCLCVLLVSDIVIYRLQERRNELLIYYSGQNLIMSTISGHRHLVLTESNSKTGIERDLENLKDYWLDRQIYTSLQLISMDSVSAINSISGDKIAITHSRAATSVIFADKNYYYLRDFIFGNPEKVFPKKVEALIIGRSSPYPDEQKLNGVYISKIVFCKSTYYSSKKKWLTYAEQRGIACFDIAEHGAFRVSENQIYFGRIEE